MKRENYLSWDEYFMAITELSAMRSKDPSTQVGACIVSDDNRILSIGYNGAPNGFNDDEFPWGRDGENLNTKYPYVCHAELNAFPCNECAKIIIQAGIKEVIYLNDKYANSDNNIASRTLFDKCNIKYHKISMNKEIKLNMKNN